MLCRDRVVRDDLAFLNLDNPLSKLLGEVLIVQDMIQRVLECLKPPILLKLLLNDRILHLALYG